MDQNLSGIEGWTTPEKALARVPVDPVESTPDASITFSLRHGFRIGPLGLLVEDGISAELSSGGRICRLPNTVDWFLGLLNLRGNLVPVFDLARFLDAQAVSNDEPLRILVLDKGETAIGLRIDDLPKSLSLGEPLQQKPPVDSRIEPFLRSAYLEDGELWLNLHVGGLMDSLASRISRN